MSKNNETVLNLMKHPSNVQHRILSDMEGHIGDGRTVTSPNNVVSHLVESFSNISANLVHDVTHNLEQTFPKRALDRESLFKHMSDFDYIGLFASPVSTFIELTIKMDIFNNEALRDEAIGSYRITIPSGSIFNIGGYSFTLHHDIELLRNSDVGVVTARHTTQYNPIYSIVNRELESRVFEYAGVSMVAIKIPVQQFSREFFTEDLYKDTPFSKIYTYDNKFYAIRISTNKTYSDDSDAIIRDVHGTDWTELHQTLSSEIYDPSINKRPTAIINVDDFANSIKVTIPYIYISSGVMGSKLKLEILNSRGKVDIDLTNVFNQEIAAKFPSTGNKEIDKFVTPLSSGTDLTIMAMEERVVGGTDGLDFDRLRNRIIYDTFQDQLLVTPLDLEAFYTDRGFAITKFKDGITSRIYFAHKELYDLSGSIVAAGNIRSVINTGLIEAHAYAGIHRFEDKSISILPSTKYRYDTSADIVIPMTDNEVNELENEIYVKNYDRINSNTFTYSPFITNITLSGDVPIGATYDVEAPIINAFNFIAEAVGDIDATVDDTTLSIYDQSIRFDNDTNSYVLDAELLLIDLSGGSEQIHPNDVKVALVCTDAYGATCHKFSDDVPANVVFDPSTSKYTFSITMGTDYHFTGNKNINLIMADDEAHPIPFKSDFQLVCYIDERVNKSLANATTYPVIQGFLPITSYLANTEICKCIKEIFNGIDIVYDKVKSLQHTEPILARYETTAYWRDTSDLILHGEDGDTVKLVTLFSEGDPIYGDTIVDTIDVVRENINVDDYVLLSSDIGDDNIYPVKVTDNILDIMLANFDETHMFKKLDPENIVSDDDEYVDGTHFIIGCSDASIPDGTTITDDNIATLVATTGIIMNGYNNSEIGDPIYSNLDMVMDSDREIHYRVDMPHFSLRPLYGDMTNYANYGSNTISAENDYLKSIRTLVIANCDEVSVSKDRLLPNTEIYYRISRSIGLGLFKSGAISVAPHNLEIAVGFKLYVQRHVVIDDNIRSSMAKTIDSIINKNVINTHFSMTGVTKEILSLIGDAVVSIDVIGIDGDTNIQTLIHAEEGNILNIKQKLIASDNKPEIVRDISIFFIIADVD